MPTIAIRGLPADMKAEIQAFGRARELSVRDAAVELIRLGLQATAARAKGGLTAQAKLTADERSTRGREAAEARWQCIQRHPGDYLLVRELTTGLRYRAVAVPMGFEREPDAHGGSAGRLLPEYWSLPRLSQDGYGEAS